MTDPTPQTVDRVAQAIANHGMQEGGYDLWADLTSHPDDKHDQATLNTFRNIARAALNAMPRPSGWATETAMSDVVQQRLIMHRDTLTLADLRDMCDMLDGWPADTPISDDGQPVTRLTATHPKAAGHA